MVGVDRWWLVSRPRIRRKAFLLRPAQPRLARSLASLGERQLAPQPWAQVFSQKGRLSWDPVFHLAWMGLPARRCGLLAVSSHTASDVSFSALTVSGCVEVLVARG